MAAPHSMTAEPSVIRPPLALRIYVIVFLCFWCVAALIFGSSAHGPLAIMVPVLMAAFGLALGYRLVRLSVTWDDGHLLVRNRLRTSRVARSDVEGFRGGPKGYQPFTRTICALLKDGTVLPLDAAERLSFLGRGSATFEDRMCSLQGWLDQR